MSPFDLLKKDYPAAKRIFEDVYWEGTSKSPLVRKLIRHGFLVRKGEFLHLGFTVVGSGRALRLMQHARQCAAQVAKENRKAIDVFRRVLLQAGYASSPLIWFSIITDVYVLEELANAHGLAYPVDRIGRSQGWPRGVNGQYWGIVRGGRAATKMGTNVRGWRGCEVRLNWSKILLRQNFPQLNTIFWNTRAFFCPAVSAACPTGKVDAQLRVYGLIDPRGKLRIPVWRRSSALDMKSRELARRLAKSFAHYWKKNSVAALFNGNSDATRSAVATDSRYRFIMFYHEAEWQLVELLEMLKILTVNRALRQRVDPARHDIRDVLLLTVGPAGGCRP